MKRNKDESFEDYQVRRKEANKQLKQKLKGTLIHASTVYFDDPDGNIQKRSSTYRRPENV